jgi:hypothetical protein
LIFSFNALRFKQDSQDLAQDVSRFHDLVNSIAQNSKASRNDKAQQTLKRDRDAAKQLLTVIHNKLQVPPQGDE